MCRVAVADEEVHERDTARTTVQYNNQIIMATIHQISAVSGVRPGRTPVDRIGLRSYKFTMSLSLHLQMIRGVGWVCVQDAQVSLSSVYHLQVYL